MITIYGATTFNATKVLFTAEEIGLDYDYVHLDLAKGEHKSPEHLARHPLGKVPALEHDGHCLIESASMCRYLANISDHKLYSVDPLRAAHIDQMIDLVSHHVGRWLAVYFYQEIILQRFYKKEPDQKAIAEAKGFLEQQLPYLEQTLKDSRFLCGAELTLADTVAVPYFHAALTTSFTLEGFPAITRWYQEVSQRPAFIKAQSATSR